MDRQRCRTSVLELGVASARYFLAFCAFLRLHADSAATIAARARVALSPLDDAATSIKKAIVEAELKQTTVSIRGAASSVDDAATKLGGEAGSLDETLRGLREALEAIRSLAARLDRDPTMLIRGRDVHDGIDGREGKK